MVAILIPTYNRSEYLIRQLTFYREHGCEHPVYIVDSSDEHHGQATQAFLSKLGSDLRVHYFKQPRGYPMVCLRALRDEVAEEFVAYTGDDDFFVPESLTQAAKFLSQNPDYSTAKGEAVSFHVERGSAYGKIYAINPYAQPPQEEASQSERVRNFLDRYFCTLFSVSRKHEFFARLNAGDGYRDRAYVDEALPSALAIVEGKSKTLPILGLLRQDHPQRNVLIRKLSPAEKEERKRTEAYFQKSILDRVQSRQTAPLSEQERDLLQSCLERYALRMNPEAKSGWSGFSPVHFLAERLPWLRELVRSVKSPQYENFLKSKPEYSQILSEVVTLVERGKRP